MNKSKLITSAIFLGVALSAPSAVIISSAGITATSPNDHSAPFTAANTLDGLTLEGFKNTGDAGPPVRPANHQNNHWITTDGTLTSTITFDLGGAYDLAKISVLNTSNTNWNDRETDTFTIATSTDGGSSYSTPSSPVTLQDYTLGFQDVTLTDTGVTHVQLAVTNDPAAGTNTGTADTAVGLNEVQFYQIPEPSSAVLLALGLGLAGRRRRA